MKKPQHTNILFSILSIFSILISINTFASETPAIFVDREALPPCYIQMIKIPGFTFTLNQPIAPINVRAYISKVIGNCSLFITAADLPEGLTLKNEGTTSVIFGTPTKAGFSMVMVTIQARNNAVSASFPVTVLGK